MAVESRLLIRFCHGLLGVVSSPPSLGGIDVDIFWTAKAVHRVVRLNAFPAMVVIVFVKNEIHVGPAGSEERVKALIVRHVHQFVDLSPVVPLKAGVKLGVPFASWVLVYH